MKRFILAFIVAVILAPATTLAANDDAGLPSLRITEVYLGSPSSGSDEYVVVTNLGSAPIDIKGLSIEYKSATGKTWSTKAQVAESRELAPYADLTFAVTRTHDYELKSGMSQTAGNVRLQAGDGNTLDQLAWGNGDSPEGHAAPAPKAGESLVRICDEAARTCQDSDDNVVDFQIVSVDVPAGKGASNSGAGSSDATLGDESADLEITELFPDPVSPQTDSKDEFVEIYNGGVGSANLSGWKLVDAGGHVTKLSGSLAAGSYMAIYAPQSKLSLNNDGDTLSLVSPAGVTVMTTPNYGKAKAGKSFGATVAGWGWLSDPTPGGANSSLSADQSADSTTTTKKATATKSTKKTTSAKAKTKSPTLAKTASMSGKDGAMGVQDTLSSSLPWPWLLAGLGVIAVGYGAYEYRPEILSFYTKCRAKLGARK